MHHPPRVLLTLGAATLLALSLACGGGASSRSVPTSGSVDEPPPPPVADVELDCARIVAKIAACADDFETAYARTEAAGRAGKATRDAEPDGAAGAKSFMIAFRHEHNRVLGEQLCDGWQQRDPPWKARLAACSLDTSCDNFAYCAAPAIGDPLSAR